MINERGELNCGPKAEQEKHEKDRKLFQFNGEPNLAEEENAFEINLNGNEGRVEKISHENSEHNDERNLK